MNNHPLSQEHRMSTQTDIENLRTILGDRITNAVQRTDTGPKFGYKVDGQFYSLAEAVTKFLPTPEEAQAVLDIAESPAISPAVAQLAEELGTVVGLPSQPAEIRPVTVAEYETQTAPAPSAKISTYSDAIQALRDKFSSAATEPRILGEDNMSEIAREIRTRAADRRTGRPLEMLDSNPQMPLF